MSNNINSDFCLYLLIENIPNDYRTADLRNFFTRSIENESFICFNYRHRKSSLFENSNVSICSIKLFCYDEFVKLYDKKNWIYKNGKISNKRCFIKRIKFNNKEYNKNQNNDFCLNNEKEISKLLEFRKIAKFMPQGNVGTPTKVFLNYANRCLLPSSLIKQLGIDLCVIRILNKQINYKTVKYDYDNNNNQKSKTGNISSPSCSSVTYSNMNDHVFTGDGIKLISEDDEKLIKKLNYVCENNTDNINNSNNKDDDDDDDDDEIEEWEIHETLHDDCTKQERTSPYFFENEIELQWEKGGSGLVFYTDENYWKEAENKEFDAETADDLDIDMSVYYEEAGGDRDSKDLIEITQEDLRHTNKKLHEFDDYDEMQKKINSFNKNNKKIDNKKEIGYFETYTRGIGRKLLQKHGWKEGEAIGLACRSGLKEALTADGKLSSSDKTGVGYYGTKIDREKTIELKKERKLNELRHMPYHIGSKYDKSLNSQDDETILKRIEPEMKYRSNNKSNN